MAEDKLTELIAESIAKNIHPFVAGMRWVLGSVAVGTAAVVAMVADVRYQISDAHREANEAKVRALELRVDVNEHGILLNKHTLSIALLEAMTGKETANTAKKDKP